VAHRRSALSVDMSFPENEHHMRTPDERTMITGETKSTKGEGQKSTNEIRCWLSLRFCCGDQSACTREAALLFEPININTPVNNNCV
jgi:hypothetical protein